MLHVVCNDNRTMDVTSNHLDIILEPDKNPENITEGEELSKRGEGFGLPVGKSESCEVPLVGLYQR